MENLVNECMRLCGPLTNGKSVEASPLTHCQNWADNFCKCLGFGHLIVSEEAGLISST